jgi:hypothetical protein
MTSEKLTTEDIREFRAAYSLLDKKPPELDLKVRTSAILAILYYRRKSGQLHTDDFIRERALLLDNLASKDKQSAADFRRWSPSDRRNFTPYLEAHGLVDYLDISHTQRLFE